MKEPIKLYINPTGDDFKKWMLGFKNLERKKKINKLLNSKK